MLRTAVVITLLLGLATDVNADSWRKRDQERERSATSAQQRDRGDRYEGTERSDSRSNNNSSRQQRSQLSAGDAARQAQSRYGGRVLKVSDAGGQYIVRLLLDDGRVINVPVSK